MKTVSKSFLTKVVAMFIIIALFATAFMVQGIVFAENAQSPPTNVEYFEGYGQSLSAQDIHNKTRIPSHVDEAPSITVFTHGQGGDASHWSNDGNGNLTYDTVSLVEKFRNDAGGANVYWARMSMSRGRDT